MPSNFATYITKEDFKRALSDCFKEAWVWHSENNFKAMFNWQMDQKLIYYGQKTIGSEIDFNRDDIAIDLIKKYQEGSGSFQQKFGEQFISPEGFSYDQFLGETLEDGFSVGQKARTLFEIRAQKEKASAKVLDLSEDSYKKALFKTKTLFQRQNIDYSYGFELAFSYDEENLKIRPDILKFKPNHHVDIIEIKATSKAKKEHFFDLAYQIYVLEKNGLIVDNAFLGHLNPDFIWGWDEPITSLSEVANNLYQETSPISFEEAWQSFTKVQYQSDPINSDAIELDLELLFRINPEYRKLRDKSRITYIEAYRQLNQNNYLDYLFKELTNLLNLSPSQIFNYLNQSHCSFRHEYRATKKEKLWLREKKPRFCYHILPWFDLDQESIFDLMGASNFTNHHKARIYRETNLVYLKDISSLAELEAKLAHWKKPIFLEPHYRHFEVYRTYCQEGTNFNETAVLKKPLAAIKENLRHYQKYPIVMYDFETAKWAIPRFLKTKTYQQIPFQYSMDVLVDEHYDYRHLATMKHHDFLATKRIDPRPHFIKNFLKAALSYGPATYVAYNDAFEKMILKQLAFLFPQYQIPLLYIVQNTIDLMTFFKGKKDYWPWFEIYHPHFRGSYSIKKTQPALEPTFIYDDLMINKGDQAAQTFREFIDGYLPPGLWEQKIYFDLLKYCNHDTLAMVVLLQRIREIYLQEVKNNGQI